MDYHNKYKCYDDIVVGKSFFKGEKKNNLVYFERSILNMMIMDNYLKKIDDNNKNGTSKLGNIYFKGE
tara:strand:- start:551 stop:754 length:204 start_codon:yes stop_codon:yes gene_type:complete